MKKFLSLVLVLVMFLPMFSFLPSAVLAESSANSTGNGGYSLITDGLVAYYDGSKSTKSGHDKTSDVWADLVSGYDMTVVNDGNSTFTDDGYYVNGSTSAFPEEITNLINSDSFTVEIMMSDFDPTGTTYNRIIRSNNDRFVLYRHASNKNLQFKIAGLGGVNRAIVSSCDNFIQNDVHIALTYEKGGKSKIYINGALKASVDATETDMGADTIYLASTGSTVSINALFRSIKFYNNALSAEKISSNSSAEFKKANLSGYDYITDGLVSLYDGKNNDSRGHNTDSTVWQDLASGYNMTVLNDGQSTFTSEGYLMKGSSSSFPDEIVSLVNGNEFTVELFFSDFVATGISYNQLIRSENDNLSLYRHVSNKNLQFKYAGLGLPNRSVVSNVDDFIGNDTLISITYTVGGSCLVYVNGELKTSTSAPKGMEANNLFIGNSNKGYSAEALLRSIRFYSRALNETEIRNNAIADGIISYISDGLVSHFNGNQNTGEGQNITSQIWEDLVSGYDMSVTQNQNNYFTNDGYRLSNSINYFPEELVNLINGEAFTLELLVKDFSPISTSFNNIISSQNDKFTLFRRASSDTLEFKYAGVTRATIPSAESSLQNLLITITYDTLSKKAIIYFNGQKMTETSEANVVGADNLFIGQTATNRNYTMLYRDVRFYNRVLSEEEVAYNASIDKMYKKGPDTTYINVMQPKTNISGDITITREVNSLFELNSMMSGENLPAAAIYRINSEGNITDENGNSFITIGEALELTEYSVLPILIPENEAAIEAISDFCKKTGFYDLTILSSDENLVKSARTSLKSVRGAIDLTTDYSSALTDDDCISIRRLANTNRASAVIIPLGSINREKLIKLNNMQINVFLKCPDEMTIAQHYEALLSGAIGIISDSSERLLDIACNEIAPNTVTRPTLNIGHTGLPSAAPANTVEGSLEAYRLGANVVEMDVQLSADGEIVVMHDATTGATCSENLTVKTSTWAELSALYVNKGYEDTKYAECRIPRLNDYFEAFSDTDCKLFIEVKTTDTAIVSKIMALVEEYDMYDRCTIITFYNDILSTFSKDFPEMSIGKLNSNPVLDEENADKTMKDVMSEIGAYNATFNPSINTGVGAKAMRAALLRGISLYPYTFYGTLSSYEAHYLAGYPGLTGNHAEALGGLPVEYEIELSTPGLSVGQSADLLLALKNYDGSESLASGIGITVLEGNECVNLNGSRLTAIKDGEVTVVISYEYTLVNSCASICTVPFTFTVEAAPENTEPSLTILAGNVEYRDYLHILYAIDANLPDGVDKNSVKMLFWNGEQNDYTKDSEDIAYISGVFDTKNVKIGQITYNDALIVKSYGIAAKEIVDYVYARAYINIDGKDYYSQVLRYSVLEYVHSRFYDLDNAETTNDATVLEKRANQRKLYEKILNYGAAAQKILNYKLSTLATNDYSYIRINGGTLSDGFSGGVYPTGSQLTVKADPARVFINWTDENGNVVSESEEYSFNLTDSLVLTANYDQTTAKIVSNAGLYGERFNVGDILVLSAEKNNAPGTVFEEWDLNGAKVSNELILTATVTEETIGKTHNYTDSKSESIYLYYQVAIIFVIVGAVTLATAAVIVKKRKNGHN